MISYYKVKGSESGHCCFDWTVVNSSGDSVCECFDEEDADRIVKALNGASDD